MTVTGLGAALLVLVLAWPGRPAPQRMLGLRPSFTGPARPHIAIIAGVATVAGLVLVAPPLGLGLGLLLALRPRWLRHRRNTTRRRATNQALPDVIDLLVVALGAGFTPTLAVQHVAPLAPSPVDEALDEVLRRVARGVRFADALDALVDVLGDAARPLMSALVAGERDGVPLGPTLDVLAREAKAQRRHAAETAARRLPVLLAFPLACCILPAFVLLTVAPLLAGALASLQS
jgi:Flp pilus assembly protein TadB